MKNKKEILSNYPYLIWVAFYATLFWLIFGASRMSFAIVLIVYTLSIILACTPCAELIWRKFKGVRRVATQREKDRLLPIFEEVYQEALRIDKYLFKHIKLFIKDTMEINAFAFGQETLVITKGSINQLSDEDLKGLIVHEFCHFSNYDTIVILFASISNILMESFLRFICWITKPVAFIHNIVNGIRKALVFIGDLILMRASRKNEYIADIFAEKCGYQENLINTLYQFYETSMSEPKKIIEQLRSTHPPLVNRIEKLENI